MATGAEVPLSPVSWSNGSDKDWSFSRLLVTTVKCSHTWTIENFGFYSMTEGESLQSPNFSDGPTSKLKWRLLLFPNGKTKEVSDYISLYLDLVASNVKTVFVKYEISILNSNKKMVKKNSAESRYIWPATVVGGWGWKEFVRRDALLSKKENGLLPDEELTVHCEVIAFVESMYVTNPERPFRIKKIELPLAKNLASLLESEICSDVTLKIQEREIRAHKAILAASSPVFSAMFEHDMKEKSTNVVDIKDFDCEAIRAMLRYMYTGEAPDLDVKIAKEVLAASDKYSIESLKSICEEYLSLNLTVETAADLMYLADKHNADDLKRRSSEFIRIHADQVLETPSWNMLADLQPQLLLDAFKELALHHYPALTKKPS